MSKEAMQAVIESALDVPKNDRGDDFARLRPCNTASRRAFSAMVQMVLADEATYKVFSLSAPPFYPQVVTKFDVKEWHFLIFVHGKFPLFSLADE